MVFFGFYVAKANIRDMACEEVFDQGKWGHCTLFAISMAIHDACWYHGVKISAEDVRKLLVSYEDIFENCNEGHFPRAFDGKTLRFENPTRDEWLAVKISVQQTERRRFKDNQPVRYVIVVVHFMDGDKSHAMYVLCTTEQHEVKYFKCVNSIKTGGKYPIIPFDQENNELFKISIAILKRKIFV